MFFTYATCATWLPKHNLMRAKLHDYILLNFRTLKFYMIREPTIVINLLYGSNIN